MTAVASRTAYADLRSFTSTYEYSTQPEGRTAVELWHTQTRATPDASSPHLYEGILEIEHGITEHWDIGFNTVIAQTAGDATMSDPLHLAAVEIESRYRFAERGELPIDSLVFVELTKQFGDSIYTVEGRLSGSRDFGDLSVSANASVEVATGNDVPETDLDLGWSVGATYQVAPRFRLGVETWAIVEDGAVFADVGPALSFALASNFWTAITAGFALTERDTVLGTTHGAMSARVILGIEL
jgi:hypothetical protein